MNHEPIYVRFNLHTIYGPYFHLFGLLESSHSLLLSSLFTLLISLDIFSIFSIFRFLSSYHFPRSQAFGIVLMLDPSSLLELLSCWGEYLHSSLLSSYFHIIFLDIIILLLSYLSFPYDYLPSNSCLFIYCGGGNIEVVTWMRQVSKQPQLFFYFCVCRFRGRTSSIWYFINHRIRFLSPPFSIFLHYILIIYLSSC